MGFSARERETQPAASKRGPTDEEAPDDQGDTEMMGHF